MLRSLLPGRHALGPALLFVLAIPVLAAPPGEGWNYLPQDDIRATDFKAEHPTWDGRGVVVAILDTGVDVFAPGLTETSTGQTKVIDVRDLSTEGDWSTEAAEFAEGAWQAEDGFVLRGAGELAVPPVNDSPPEYPVYVGAIREPEFLNNPEVNDLNDDGDTDDEFGFLVYLADRADVERELGIGRGLEFYRGLNETAAASVAEERQSAKVWLVVVDTDGDGDLAGEKLLRDYHVNFDSFGLSAPRAPDSKTLMAWEVNVRENESQRGQAEPPTVEFHFDDGSHGSHCAGIAAGFRVSGQAGLDGVAPGAWVISCKLGDNRLAGGATRTESMKKAYETAVAFGKRWGLPVVVNMSFGINSVEEAEDTMGRWLDDLMADNPDFYVCTSAGNEGPGLSTIGIPATSQSLISSGAYLSVGTGADLYDAKLQRNTLFTFSSRGGETPKPDVVSPGSALSTVPGYVEGSARFNGTSMASPQTAGAVACLLSAARQEGLTTHWGMVKRALIAGASRVDGLALTDQGGGLVNIPATWPLLETLAESESAHDVLWWDIETACPFQQDGEAPAAYWRVPGGVPTAPEEVTFTVRPIFHPDLTPDEKDAFYRSFKLRSEAPWLDVVAGKRYVRGDMGMTVDVRYDGDELTSPGLYSARVIATLDGGDLSGLAAREFALWNMVVIGETLGPDNGFSRSWERDDLPVCWVDHHYVDVPSGASALRARLEVSQEIGASKGAMARIEINDPEGVVRGGWAGYATVDGDPIVDMTVTTPELYPGTWEINVCSNRQARDTTDYRLTVSCDGYDTEPAVITELPRPGTGKDAGTDLSVTRSFPGVFAGDVSATIDGFRKVHEVELEDTDEWTQKFTLDGTTPRALFELEMTEKVANYFTDCAVNILDSSGKAVRQTGFSGKEVQIGVSLPQGQESATFTLQVVGAFAIAEQMKDWGFSVTEHYLFGSPVRGEVSREGGGSLKLYCGVPTPLSVSFDGDWPAAPEGMGYGGQVTFRDTNLSDKAPGDRGGRVVLEVPIEIGE